MEISSKSLHKALKSYFGFDGFKGLQESVVTSILSKKDTFAVMPTGGGKSLCYQLPALMQDGTRVFRTNKKQLNFARCFECLKYYILN